MYHMPISDELAIKLNADRILNFLSETLSVPDEVRDLLRKAPQLQDINMLTSLLLATADERVPTKAIVWDAIVRAAKTGPSFPAANSRDVIDELTLALPDNQALSNLKEAAKHTPSRIFAQNILADASSLTRVGYRVRFYDGVIPYTSPAHDVLHIFPRHRGFGYEEYIDLMRIGRNK